jgi:hypothetical protein
MSVAILKGLLALATTSVLFGGSAILFRNRRTAGRLLQLLGVGCFVVVALTHVFEAFRVFPSMGWGSPRSVGHYIDLGAAFLGLTLLSAGFLLHALRIREERRALRK